MASRYRAIHVLSQEKTKATVLVPISDELQEVLDAWRAFIDRREAEIHANRGINYGRSWIPKPGSKTRQNAEQAGANADLNRTMSADYILRSPSWLYRVNKQRFKEVMREAIRKIGLPTYRPGVDETYELTFSTHGLRKSGMSAIAEAGGTTLQIMSISGHTSHRNVDHYVQDMEKQRAAIAAMQLRQAMTNKRKAAKARSEEASRNVVPLGRNKPGSV